MKGCTRYLFLGILYASSLVGMQQDDRLTTLMAQENHRFAAKLSCLADAIDNEDIVKEARAIFTHIQLNQVPHEVIAKFIEILKHKEAVLNQELDTLSYTTNFCDLICIPLDALSCGTLRHCLPVRTKRYVMTFSHFTHIATFRSLTEERNTRLKID